MSPPNRSVELAVEVPGTPEQVWEAIAFGDQAPRVAARDEPAWRAWMDEHFPSVEAASKR